MRDVARSAPTTRLRPAAGLVMVALVSGAILAERPTTYAADPMPPPLAAARFLAARDGGSASDYRLLYQRTTRGADGRQLWAGKLLDRRSGEIRLVYRDANGHAGGPELLSGLARAAEARQSALERKASAPLQAAMSAQRSSRGLTSLPVAVWLAVDTAAAVQAVQARHPEVRWIGGRPLVDDLATARRLRADLWRARRDAYAAAAGALAQHIKGLGGTVAYASSSAPLLFADLPPTAVPALADRPEVTALGLEGRWQPAMSAAAEAVDANWTSGAGDRGNGVRVAVVEYHNVHRSGDLSGAVVKSHSTTGSLAYAGGRSFDHPTWVAGAIASQSGKYPGVAPGADIVSSSTGGYRASLTYDRRIIAAADWAISPRGGDADVLNTSLVQDTATGAEEARRYFDSVADDDMRLAVSAAGNYVNFNGWQIGSPGTAYNVLTVGGVNDRGTKGRSDDRLWYVPGSNGSNWLDRPSDPWNAHGDYNKPNLVAPAVNVRTANGLAASGTSVATPIVSGIAAQLLANEPALAAWPEGARAVLMAGAVHRVRMPDGSRNVDHEGVGMASAKWTNLIAHPGDGTLGGYRIGSMVTGDHVTQQIAVRGGDRLRVALAWNSHTTGSRNLSKTDVLRTDLDLRVIAPNGTASGSFTIDNAYEFVEVEMAGSGTAIIEIRQTRFDASSETYGLAWAKVRDATRPSVDARAPADGEPWAVPTSPLRVEFSEAVENVVAGTFSLVRSSTGAAVDATVSYSASSQVAMLRPSSPLSAGWYEARLTGGITDRAGNALRSTAWTIRVRRPAANTGGGAGRRARLSAGGHAGYRFDGAGTVIDSRHVTLSSASRVDVGERAIQPERGGYWLLITSGSLAGYWVRESASSGIIGSVGAVDLPSGQALVLRAETHIGRRFNDGSVVSSRTWHPDSDRTLIAGRRAVINGIRRLRVSGGRLDHYWVNESSAAYLPGVVQLTDLDRATASVPSGTRTGYRYYDSGRVRSSKASSLRSAQATLLSAWAIVNGRPRIFALGGRWAGYWIASSGVPMQ